jgi:hypothetical protein
LSHWCRILKSDVQALRNGTLLKAQLNDLVGFHYQLTHRSDGLASGTSKAQDEVVVGFTEQPTTGIVLHDSE